MTEATLKAVLKIDEQNKTFLPVAHNLSADEAEAKVSELKGQGVQTQVLPQASRHKGQSYKTCELCKNAAQNLSQGTASDAHAEEANEEEENINGC